MNQKHNNHFTNTYIEIITRDAHVIDRLLDNIDKPIYMQDWEQRAQVLQEACLSIQESNEDNSSRIKGLKSIYINVLNHLKQEITGGILSPSKENSNEGDPVYAPSRSRGTSRRASIEPFAQDLQTLELNEKEKKALENMHHIMMEMNETFVNDQTIIDSVDDNRLMDMITHLLMLANSLKSDNPKRDA